MEKPIIADGFIVSEGNPREFYVDGVTNSFLGSPVSKITFHTVTGIDAEGREQRQPTVRLVLQTGALIEFCRNILSTSLTHKEGMKTGFNVNIQQLDHFLQGLEIADLPPAPTMSLPE